MTLKSLTLALVFTPAVAFAQNTPQTVAPEKVISSVTGDWNDDGAFDRAVLIQGDDEDAGLAVYLSDVNGDMKPAGWGPDIAWSGGSWGQQATLSLSDKGGLQVHTENTGIGRDHWEQILTVAFRGGQMVVAGVTLHTYDTLQEEPPHDCDINLLTGKGIADKKSITVATGGVPLSQWTDDSLPKACRF